MPSGDGNTEDIALDKDADRQPFGERQFSKRFSRFFSLHVAGNRWRQTAIMSSKQIILKSPHLVSFVVVCSAYF